MRASGSIRPRGLSNLAGRGHRPHACRCAIHPATGRCGVSSRFGRSSGRCHVLQCSVLAHARESHGRARTRTTAGLGRWPGGRMSSPALITIAAGFGAPSSGPPHLRCGPDRAEGRAPSALMRQRADDQIRADRSDCAAATPACQARRRARGEDDTRADGGVPCRRRAHRDPGLRELLTAFSRRANRPQPGDGEPGVGAREACGAFQAGQEAARAPQSRASRTPPGAQRGAPRAVRA